MEFLKHLMVKLLLPQLVINSVIFLETIGLLSLLEKDLYMNNAKRMENRDSLNQIINQKMVLKLPIIG